MKDYIVTLIRNGDRDFPYTATVEEHSKAKAGALAARLLAERDPAGTYTVVDVTID